MADGKLQKVYKFVTPSTDSTIVPDSQDISGGLAFHSHSWYQRLVQGSSTRQVRYREYDNMDDDIEVARALDTIAGQMSITDSETDLPFLIKYDIPTSKIDTSLTTAIREALKYWCKIQEFNHRIFNTSRVLVKYGDCFFQKAPKDKYNTKKWIYINPKNVVAAVVDSNDITKVKAYQVRVDTKEPNHSYAGVNVGGQEYTTEFIPASEMVVFSLCDEMEDIAPFGESILKPVYRTFKQLSLLEDSIIIYRITRAPERRIFNVDVGGMNPARRKTYLEQFKNEVNQKKIPSSYGGKDQVESVYNPHSIQEDYFFGVSADGRGTKVDTLPGGQGLGDMSEVEYFLGKVYRGLRVPTSYLQVTPSTAQSPIFQDGKAGQAYIEELEFAKFCNRNQKNMNYVYDKEFKLFLQAVGLEVDTSIFHIELPEPTNMALYKQQEADSALLNTMGSADGFEAFSKRFVMKRFGQMSEDQIRENEQMKAQELGIDPNDRDFYKKIYGGDEGEEGFGPGGVDGGLGDLSGGDLSGEMDADDLDVEGVDDTEDTELGAEEPSGEEDVQL